MLTPYGAHYIIHPPYETLKTSFMVVFFDSRLARVPYLLANELY
jgi:hypothetical protein